MRRQIEALIEKEEFENAYMEIERYERLCPKDADLAVYKFLYHVYTGEYEAALEYARKAVKLMPYSADVHYNYATALQLFERWEEAYEQLGIAWQLAKCKNPCNLDTRELEQQMKETAKQIAIRHVSISADHIEWVQNWAKYLKFKENIGFDILSSIFNSNYPIVAEEYRDYVELPPLYVAVAGEEKSFWLRDRPLEKEIRDKIIEVQRVSQMTKEASIQTEEDCFLPIVMEQRALLKVECNGQNTEVPYTQPYQYVNYRIPKGKTALSSGIPFRLGEAVPIEHSRDRKRLVLSIFVDGLSQLALSEKFPEYMPHTYEFFKKGMICTNSYSAGDWTYPSVASLVTGQTPAEHRMLHPKLLRKLEADIPILYEYFKKAGYNTTKISGDWRGTPNYGYARGMNRVFYGNYYYVYSTEKIVSDTIEQMHRMRETDQYIWLETGELHKIADGLDLGFLMSEIPISDIREITAGENSVKQAYDEMKIKYYIQRMASVDRKLAALFQYIEEHYSEDEILISLFADHGQGYLVRTEEEFLGPGRSKVAFMVRGNRLQGQSEELISTCDYPAILCKMAGIPFQYDGTDAHLPLTFGGTEEREYAISESIHVNDPYYISLKGKDFDFYLESKEPVTSECRIPLKEYTVKLLDKSGNELHDMENIIKCRDVCLEHIAPCVIFDN